MKTTMSATPDSHWLVPDWPAPARVRALSTTRHGGVSQGPYGLAGGVPGGHSGRAATSAREQCACLTVSIYNRSLSPK